MRSTFLPFALPDTDQTEIDEVAAAIRSGWVTTGPKTRQFEAEFAAAVGAKHAVAVNSCTAAMHLALEAVGLQAGDEVITTPYTFAATAEVIRYFEARPVFVDVRPDTLNLDPALIEPALTGRTKAIIPVHMAGLPADLAAIYAIAARHHLAVIEDAAHAFPARYQGRMIGGAPPSAGPPPEPAEGGPPPQSPSPQPSGEETASRPRGRGSLSSPPLGGIEGGLSHAVCFSFYATKTITTGEGGMLCTDDPALAERCRMMALHGISKDAWKRYTAEGNWYYEITAPGYKYNMTDIAAAMGLVQLSKAERMWQRRREIAQRYHRAFATRPELQLPADRADCQHAWHLYTLRLNLAQLTLDRAQFIEALKQRNIGTSVHFIPLHLHPYYRQGYGYQPGDFPVAFDQYQRVISLPIYSKMSDQDVEDVIQAVLAVVDQHRVPQPVEAGPHRS